MRRYLPRRATLVGAAAVLAGLAVLEWATSVALDNSLDTGGILRGLALGAVLLGAALAATRARGQVALAAAGALSAIGELAFGAVVLFTLAAGAAALLPVSVSATFMQGERATDFIVYCLLGLGALVAIRSTARYIAQARRAASAELDAARAAAALAEREMALLRAQIEPHFLWNTLAHVQYLARKNGDDAARMTGHLIAYLRSAVPGPRERSTFASEAESVGAYLELMKIRMGERLTTSIDVAPALADHALAPLLLHTLVENAVKHGVEPKVGDVHIAVAASLDPADPERLLLEVSDSGVGLQAAPSTRGTGVGLRNVRERLTLLYGPNAVLAIAERVGGGVVARIELPRAGAAGQPM